MQFSLIQTGVFGRRFNKLACEDTSHYLNIIITVLLLRSRAILKTVLAMLYYLLVSLVWVSLYIYIMKNNY